MNTLVVDQVAPLTAVIEQAGVLALRIAFTIAVVALAGAGLFIFHKRHQFFDRDFIGKTAVAVGSFAVLQKVAGADRSKSDPGPGNQTFDGQNSEWLAHTPPEAVMAHLNIDKATFDAIPKNGVSVTPLS
jgi:hypothetical protein